MRTELTELEEQEVEEALKRYMDLPVNGSSVYIQFGIWLIDEFGGRGLDPEALLNYAECFCFSNNLHPHGP